MRRRRSYYDRYYAYFREEDEEESEDDAFRDIAHAVDRIWHSKWWSKNIRDDESQRQLITAMRARYIYPDYLDLVGLSGPDDYRAEGKLTTSRKAELLLIGTFTWQGLTIAKHPSVFGYNRDRWSFSISPRWKNRGQIPISSNISKNWDLTPFPLLMFMQIAIQLIKLISQD